MARVVLCSTCVRAALLIALGVLLGPSTAVAAEPLRGGGCSEWRSSTPGYWASACVNHPSTSYAAHARLTLAAGHAPCTVAIGIAQPASASTPARSKWTYVSCPSGAASDLRITGPTLVGGSNATSTVRVYTPAAVKALATSPVAW